MKEFPFNTTYTQITALYGLELKPEQFEEIGMIGWEKINNKRTKMYRYPAITAYDNETESYYVELPCNCEYVESVHRMSETKVTTSPTDILPDVWSGYTEDYIESRKINRSKIYTKGELLKYEYACGKLYFKEDWGTVVTAYKGVFLDEEGLPYLSTKEIDAVAAYCAYITFRKKYYQTRDQSILMASQIAEKDWLKMCNAARIPQHLSQNDMDEVLNAKSSWDRKRYNKSFKPTN